MAESGKKWYVVRAVNGKETKVKEQLELEIERNGVSNLVDQILIPKEKVIQIRNGKKIAKERNFFPGYVLIEAVLDGEVPHIIKNVTNVIGFLGEEKGGEPLPMRQSEVNRILGKVDELAATEGQFEANYLVGDRVKVVDGPFNTFEGVIEEVQEDKKKLKVMVKIFERRTPIELNYGQVEKQ